MDKYFFTKIDFFHEKGVYFSISSSQSEDITGAAFEAISSLFFVLEMAKEPVPDSLLEWMIDRLKEIKERQMNNDNLGVDRDTQRYSGLNGEDIGR